MLYQMTLTSIVYFFRLWSRPSPTFPLSHRLWWPSWTPPPTSHCSGSTLRWDAPTKHPLGFFTMLVVSECVCFFADVQSIVGPKAQVRLHYTDADRWCNQATPQQDQPDCAGRCRCCVSARSPHQLQSQSHINSTIHLRNLILKWLSFFLTRRDSWIKKMIKRSSSYYAILRREDDMIWWQPWWSWSDMNRQSVFLSVGYRRVQVPCYFWGPALPRPAVWRLIQTHLPGLRIWDPLQHKRQQPGKKRWSAARLWGEK